MNFVVRQQQKLQRRPTTYFVASQVMTKPRIRPERVKRLREKEGLSQSALGRLIDAKPQTVQQIEAGIIHRPRCLLQLARKLRTKPEWLMGEGRDDDPPVVADDGAIDADALAMVMDEVRAFYGESMPDTRTEAEHITRLYRRLMERRRA